MFVVSLVGGGLTWAVAVFCGVGVGFRGVVAIVGVACAIVVGGAGVGVVGGRGVVDAFGVAGVVGVLDAAT